MNWYKQAKLSRYDRFMNRLEAACDKSQLDLTEIATAGDYKVYAITINPTGGNPLVVVAGTHGEEPGAPYGVLTWLEHAQFPKSDKVVIIPLSNPHGFDHEVRTDHERNDSNRHFLDGEATEVNEAIAKTVIDAQPTFLLDLHEDESKSDFYMYASVNAKKSLIKMVHELAKKFFRILGQGEVYHSCLENGIVTEPPMKHSKTLDNYAFQHGIEYITPEAPGKAPLEDRIDFFVELLNHIVR